MTKRSSTTENALSEKIHAVLTTAGLSSAEWENGQLVKGGVRMMLSGGAVEVDYVDPHNSAEYKAAAERMMSVLNERFHDKRVELEGRTYRLSVRDETSMRAQSYGYTHVMVHMYWVSGT